MKCLRTIAVPLLCTLTLTVSVQEQQAVAQSNTIRSFVEPQSANRRAAEPWRARIKQELPLLGHRNWILIVDSAYPLQTSPGVETIETGATLPVVAQEVMRDLDGSIHVRPIVYMDAELPYLSDQGAPGVTRYRHDIQAILGNRPVTQLQHERIISKIDESGKIFHILVLKTTSTIPYTSVFLQLDCKYWSTAAEAQLRKAMKIDHR